MDKITRWSSMLTTLSHRPRRAPKRAWHRIGSAAGAAVMLATLGYVAACSTSACFWRSSRRRPRPTSESSPARRRHRRHRRRLLRGRDRSGTGPWRAPRFSARRTRWPTCRRSAAWRGTGRSRRSSVVPRSSSRRAVGCMWPRQKGWSCSAPRTAASCAALIPNCRSLRLRWMLASCTSRDSTGRSMRSTQRTARSTGGSSAQVRASARIRS